MAIKRWFIFSLLILSFQSMALADEIVTTVFNVLESQWTDKILLLSTRDGRVYTYKMSESNLKYLKSFLGDVVRINYTRTKNESAITNISRVNSWEVGQDEIDLNNFKYHQLRKFAPTDLQSEEAVTTVFKNLINDDDKSRSQCFKRAHIWAYDMWSKLGIQSQKVFIFYTKRYQMLEDFDWWFHVAPMVEAGGEEYVLDMTFMKKPVTVKEWQEHFIKSKKITCPIVDNYQEYEKGHYKRLCFLMKVPMFYFSPLNIKNRDKNGIERNHWELQELQDARKAFKDYQKTYEALDTGKLNITY